MSRIRRMHKLNAAKNAAINIGNRRKTATSHRVIRPWQASGRQKTPADACNPGM
jgi:hypothetical protein